MDSNHLEPGLVPVLSSENISPSARCDALRRKFKLPKVI